MKTNCQQAELGIDAAAINRPTWADGPNTLWLVGISGGKDSAAALLKIVRESGIPKDRIRACFCDTENEHEWTYEHVRLLSREIHPIETIKPSIGFYPLALQRKRFPSSQVRFCTEVLKIWATQDHIVRLRAQGHDVISVSGVRADESDDRKNQPEWDYSGTLLCHVWRPLIQSTIQDVYDIHARHGIPLNPLYAAGAQRVGCFPCIMSTKEEIRNIALNFPERIDAIEKEENKFEKTHGGFSSFFACDKVPERFRSKPVKLGDGTTIMVPTIRDVVRWSMTGDRAKGSYQDEPQKEPVSCNSGFCE